VNFVDPGGLSPIDVSIWCDPCTEDGGGGGGTPIYVPPAVSSFAGHVGAVASHVADDTAGRFFAGFGNLIDD